MSDLGAAWLAALAVALAWPVPLLLRAARWPVRDPLAALVAWQAVSLAGGLSGIGCLLYYGVAPLAGTFPHGLGALLGGLLAGVPPALAADRIVALVAAALLAMLLSGTLLVTLVRTLRRRRKHRAMVELLASRTARVPGARLLDHPSPVAYCLPGGRGSMVLSAGLLDLLGPDELAAVVAHERAHLRGRHDLVLLPFAAWRAALPLPTARMAHESVILLVEMLADDSARRAQPSTVVAAAIAAVVAAPVPEGGIGAGQAATLRVRRLLEPSRPLPLTARLLVLCASLALVAGPTALLLAPAIG